MSNIKRNFKVENIDLKEAISTYAKHWKWFVVSAILFLALAYIYLRYATPQYSAEIQIQILEENGSGSELDVFQELNLFGGSKNKVEDEVQIIKSRSNFIEVVKGLNLNTKILIQGNVIESELYSNPPIKLNFLAQDSIINNADFEFFITLSDATSFGYSEVEDEPIKAFAFGKNIETPFGEIVITPNNISFDRYNNKKLRVVVRPIAMVAEAYRSKLIITNPGEFSNILNISLQDPIKKKAKNILDALINVYNRNAIDDKQKVADRTSDFIDDRIAEIYSNLSNVDQSAQDFKTQKGVTDITTEASINLNVGVANQQDLANARNQLNIAASMQDIVEQDQGVDFLPTNLGLSDPTIASTTQRYNQLVAERQRLLKSSNEKNPVIVNLDQEIASLKQSMQSSLKNTVDNLGMTVSTLSAQQARFNSKVYAAPRNERALRDITRRQQTTESLYLYLLQKREEAKISVASTSAKSKIIDRAFNSNPLPVSPRKTIVYLFSLIMGFIVPFSLIYANDLLDNKVHNMHTLEKLAHNIPVLGELPRISKKEQKLVIKEDRSVLAESLRIIRTNLDYLIKTKENGKNNVIFVTSSVPGEGKTFLSSNLAMILASTNKKVLLVGADIRNPKIYTFFSGSNVDKMKRRSRNKDAGLTEYLFNSNLVAKDIINPMLVHSNTIDVIYSGRIPPNPAELLMNNRMGDLFDEVSENYDYVIVDTAPLMVVTDTLLISSYADLLVYVTRAGVTENRAIDYPLKLQEEGKIKGLSFVVNDVSSSNLGYGGKYGYGYGVSSKKWWKF